MTIVLFIFMLLTIPVKILPRMLTLPVKGHFLSIYVPSLACAIETHTEVKIQPETIILAVLILDSQSVK